MEQDLDSRIHTEKTTNVYNFICTDLYGYTRYQPALTNFIITIKNSTEKKGKKSMADLIASTVAVLLEKAVSVAANRIGLVLGFYKDLEDLQGYATDIQAVLADAETKQSQNPTVLRWLQRVEGVAREATYVLDELLYESLRQQVKSRNKSMGAKVCLFFSLSKHDTSFRLRMGSKVREINAKLNTFNMEATNRIGLTRVVDALVPATFVGATGQVAKSRQTDSLALKFVAGRDGEISEIVERLLKGSSDESLYVLPIVGMGGLGKTTMAKSVYNDVRVGGHFTKKAWFCVSDQFEVMEVLRGILESLKGEKVGPCVRDVLVKQIQEVLSKERFLLVLDDVWNEDRNLWDDFYNSLEAINNIVSGSCCIVTTRSKTTAKLVSNVAPFVLPKIQDDDCWSILTHRATRGRDFPEELNVHKNQILRKCQGVPLAASAIGGLLSLHSSEKWLSVVENQVLKVNVVVGENIVPILRLSFDNLPSASIKKCFAYCSIYEKDTQMDGNELVKLWMAEGFLQDDVKRRTMEEVEGHYLTILVQSSLLEEIETSWGLEEMETWRLHYQMHDLVHDLAKCISEPAQFDLENNYDVQHLVLGNYNRHYARSPLIVIAEGYISVEFLSKFRYLHVLNLTSENRKNDAAIEKFGRSISKLKHLRCLTIEVLTDGVCKLYNLQTLRWTGWAEFENYRLPHRLCNLISLRHMLFENSYHNIMAPYMGRLTCLQTLEYFNVGKKKGYRIEELGFMKNLGGRLEIRELQLVKGNKAAMADLCGKKNLEELALIWSPFDGEDSTIDGDVELVLEGLEPHPNLRKLSINDFRGDRFPTWWGNLSALVSLALSGCYNCTKLPALGRFPHLETLNISDLINVVCIGDSYYNVEDCRIFPSLKYLLLEHMPNLTEWKELQVDHTGPSGMSPTFQFPSLEKLEIRGYVTASVLKDIICKSATTLRILKLNSVRGFSSVSDVISDHLSLTSLEEFRIYDCTELINLDIPSSTFEGCTSLKSLEVRDCPKLVSCPLKFQRTHISLETLCFIDCPNIFSTARGFAHLTNLRTLEFGPLTDDSVHLFDRSGLLGLSSTLKSLTLAGFSDKHSNIPEQLHRFTSLEYLELRRFASVESLPDWFGNLTSLRSLGLRDFPKLQYLPSASAMARLTNLQNLLIDCCPLLQQSWDDKSNDPCSEWSKISCLPNLRVLS